MIPANDEDTPLMIAWRAERLRLGDMLNTPYLETLAKGVFYAGFWEGEAKGQQDMKAVYDPPRV